MIIQLSKHILEKYEIQLIDIDNQIVDTLGDIYSTERWGKSNFESNRPGKWKYSFLALDNKKVQGCAIITEYKHKTLHINRFFVSPKYEKCGIGREMVQHLIWLKKEYKLEEINLFVSAKNVKAIQFYERHMFYRLEKEHLKVLMKDLHRENISSTDFEDNLGNKYFAYSLY